MKTTASHQELSDSTSVRDFSGASSNDWYLPPVNDDTAKALRAAAKADFMANHDVRYPDLQYQRLEELDMDTVEEMYQRLLVDAQSIDDEAISDTTYEQAARKLAELYRHKEVMRRLGWSANQALSRERAGSMTIELFGEIETEDFAHLITDLRQKATSLAGQSTEAKELLTMLGDITSTTQEPDYEISAHAIEVLREDVYELFPGLEEIVQQASPDNAPVEEKAAYWQHILDNVCGQGQTRVVLVEGNEAASTNAQEGTITIGRERIAGYSSQQLVKTGIHESIGHMVRGLRAKQQEEASMRTPQAGNLAFEEGFATGLEQIITGETRIAGEQYYLSIGLQQGIDRQGQTRDFRDTFEIMWRRLIVEELVAGRKLSREEAQNKAYTQVMRTNRGGALDARDISYFNGSKYSYGWLNSISRLDKEARIDALNIVLSARIDATNNEQWQKASKAYKEKQEAA